jgi:mono/diheme cytochrome c family protein
LVLAFGLLASLGAAGVTWAADVERGRSLFHEHGCYSCHGHTGKGTFAVAQSNLLPKPPPLLVGTAPFLMSEEVFRVYLRLRAAENPAEPEVRMPHYPQNALDDAAVADLYAYIGTFRENPPPLESIPAMRAILESAAGD